MNTGKTFWLVDVLGAALEAGVEAVVLDLAPDRVKNVGGKLTPPDSERVAYFTAPLAAPRLSGKTPEDVWRLARENRELIDGMFLEAEGLSGRSLFINDVSMYLQAGDAGDLLAFMAGFPTVVMNGYFGTSLAGGELGQREREGMKILLRACDRVPGPAAA